jgi:hypothetical protein
MKNTPVDNRRRFDELAKSLERARSEGVSFSATPKQEFHHNAMDMDAASLVAQQMRTKGTQGVELLTKELVRKNLYDFEQQVLPNLYKGKASLPNLAKSADPDVAAVAEQVMLILSQSPDVPVPLFLHARNSSVDLNPHAWGAIMRYVSRGTLLLPGFLRVDESELLVKNRAGFTEHQKTVSMANQDAKVVLYTSSGFDGYTATEEATLATLFRKWAESATAIIVVSPKPFDKWLNRLPAEIRPLLKTLFTGYIVELGTSSLEQPEPKKLYSFDEPSTDDINHSALSLLD